jgi:hypothetical protein
MAVIPVQAYEGQPGTVTAVLATVPANKRWFSLQVILSNTSGSAATVTIGKNGSAAAEQFIPAVSIPANTVETLDLGSGLVLQAADSIEGFQGTSGAITVFVGVTAEDV